jgi:hypothetical protein
LLAGGFLLAWRDHKKTCTADSLCATKPMGHWNRIALGILATGVVALAAFPYYSGAVARLVVREPGAAISASAADLSTVAFDVPDMDSPACAVGLSAAFRKLPGVITDAGFHIAPAPNSL